MNLLTNDIVKVLWFLLPGFVAAWTFSGLTRHPKLTEFERIIESLIFTAFCQVGIIVLRGLILRKNPGGHWEADEQLVWSLGVALAVGVVFAWLANHDVIHSLFRMLRITKATGYPSEWVRAFIKRGRTFVVLHLSGGRRLYGWVEEWPVEPSGGHLSVQKAEWLEEKRRIPLKGVGHVLVPASEVALVEFMDPALLEFEDGNSSKEGKTT